MYLLVSLLWLEIVFFEKTKMKQKLTTPSFAAAHSDFSCMVLSLAVHLPLACSVVRPPSSVLALINQDWVEPVAFWPSALSEAVVQGPIPSGMRAGGRERAHPGQMKFFGTHPDTGHRLQRRQNSLYC